MDTKHNTYGGIGLSHWLDPFEYDLDGGPDGAAPVEVAPPAPSPDAAPPAPVWSGPSREEWDAVMGALSAVVAPAPPAPEVQIPDLDFMSDTFETDLHAHIKAQVQQGIQSALGQYAPALDAAAAQDAEKWADSELAKHTASLGFDFSDKDVRELAIALANGYADESTNPESALGMSAQKLSSYVKAREEAAASKAVEDYKQQLATLGNAPTPPGTTPGMATHTTTPPRDELEAAARFLERNRAS